MEFQLVEGVSVALQIATLILVILLIFVVGLVGYVALSIYFRVSRFLNEIKRVTNEIKKARQGYEFTKQASGKSVGFMRGFFKGASQGK